MRHAAKATDGVRHAAHLRPLNLERVLAAAMAREGPFTRAELIQVTGLSAPTVGSLASHLIRSGVLTDLGAGPSSGGRRPAHMQFNARYGFVAGIDLGPTRTRLALADLRGQLLGRRIVSTQQRNGPAALLAALARELRALIREAGVSPSRLLVVGAGAPGAVDPARGMVVALVPNLKGWTRVPMAPILRGLLAAPVIVDNDVNLAVLGEHWKGAARGHDNCVFLSFGTGVGAGIMINGQLHHGHQFLAGEIGLMCMGPQYAGVDFGSRGCLETVAGLGALKARWPSERPDTPDWVGNLFRAAEAGDPAAQQTVAEARTFIGVATANLCSILDPSLIVLGGALMARGQPFLDEVRQIVGRIIPSPPAIVATSLDKDAPLWGTLLVAITEAWARLRHQLTHRHAAG